MKKKRYNKIDHSMSLHARREAVVFLRDRGYSFRAIGYAMGKTGEWARASHAKSERKNRCICPAAYDHTIAGHLPFCKATR